MNEACLLKGNEWLDCVHVNGALESIRTYGLGKFGLQGLFNTNWFLLDKFFNPESFMNQPHVFVLHAPNHWLTLTNVNPNSQGSWLIYDSLNNPSYLASLRHVYRRISPENNLFYVQSVNVMPQFDANDCGLFAIAYIISIAHEKDPAKLMYNQKSMRQHFNNCILSGIWTEFPSIEINCMQTYKEHVFDLSDLPVNYN